MIIVVWLSATNMSSYLMWFLLLPCFYFPALFIGVLATLHKSSIHSSKSFTGGKIKAKAAREDEGFVWGRCLCWNCDGFCSYCHIPFYILVLVFCCRLWNVTIMILNLCYVHVAFQSAPASLKLMAVFCQPQGYSLLCHNEVGSWLCK